MNCPKCNSELRPGAKFCTKCGQKIEIGAVCPQCGTSLKPGAKFCTQCGQKMVMDPTCPQCGASLKPGTKFCTKCGCRLGTEPVLVTRTESAVTRAASHHLPADMSEAKGRMYWNVQPGQVARVITEAEFETYNQIRGVIVPEGTTAYIRANGRTVASISGGSYEFVNVADSQVPKVWKMILGLFAGRKETQPSSEEEALYMHQQRVILENAKQGASFSVVILLDKAFPLMIGAKHGNPEDCKAFVPMKIQTRYLDLEVGVNAYLKISDPERFIVHYLTDCRMLNSALIANEITDTIRIALQDVLYDADLTSTRIPKELHQVMKDRINAVAAESFFGLSVVRIVEVSAASEDLERFTKLSQELYLSEKELDYLRRTNDFKNRLSDAVNEQELHQTTTELEMKRKLNEINRNKRNEELLNEDELRKFEHLLVNERIVREARTEQERNMALMEIAKTGLVREEELRVLQHQMKTNSYQRGMALAMMQLRDGIEFERVRLEGEMERAEMMVKKELDLQALRDDYVDKRFYSELDKQRAVEDAKLDLDQRRRDMDYNDVKRIHDLQREDDDAQFRQFMAMAELEERGKDKERQHELAKEDKISERERDRQKHDEEIERARWFGAQNVSEEKVWALMGGDAAVSYTQNKYNAERERETAERLEMQRREHEARLDAERASRDADRRANDERIFNMMNNMVAAMGGMQSQRAEDRDRRYQDQMAEKDRQLRERDERIRRQEGRMDTAYDRALDYTTRGQGQPQYAQPQYQPQYPPQPQYQPQPQYASHPQSQQQPAATPQYETREVTGTVCPECGAAVESGSPFCGNCGAKIE